MSGTACNQRPGSVWSLPDVIFKGELNEKGFLSCWLVDSILTKAALFFVSIVLQDVWNLVWKLDLVLHSHGNERLLDSYNAERLPVIKGVIETTDFLTKIMAPPNKFPQALRDAVMPLISRVAPFHNALVQKLCELGIAYKGARLSRDPVRSISMIQCVAERGSAAAFYSWSMTKKFRRKRPPSISATP